MLYRFEITYEFCVDAPDVESARKLFAAQHTLAIDDDRCGIIRGPEISAIERSTDVEEDTLDEVPIGAYDDTLRERLAKGE